MRQILARSGVSVGPLLRAVGVGLALSFLAGAANAAGRIELVSKADPPAETGGMSYLEALSADGRFVTFLSAAPNLAADQDDDDDSLDLFLRDQLTGTTTLLTHVAGSLEAAGRAEPGLEYAPYGTSLSADGRYVVFASNFSRLVPGVQDENHTFDLFLFDRVTAATTLITHAAGQPTVAANGRSFRARISADGNYVVLASAATDLLAGQTDGNGQPQGATGSDVFLYHRPSGTVTLVSHRAGAATTAANAASTFGGLSADGGVVVFNSDATDLVAGLVDANGTTDSFAYERSSGSVTLISRANDAPSQTANGVSLADQIGADGRWVAFGSNAGNLVSGQIDPGETDDRFLCDRTSGEIRLVTHTSDSPVRAGGAPTYQFTGFQMSADGRYFVFASAAPNLMPGQVDTPGTLDLFLYDGTTGGIALVTHARSSATTAIGAGAFASAALSADGHYAVLRSVKPDLVPGQVDTPDTADLFLYDRLLDTTTLVSHGRTSATTAGNAYINNFRFSADGSAVAFETYASNLTDRDSMDYQDVFLYKRSSGEIDWASARAADRPAVTPAGPSTLGGLSADGHFVTFLSKADDLVPGQIDQAERPWSTGSWDVFLRDVATRKTILVSHASSSPLRARGGIAPVLSGDGRYVAYLSAAADLVPGQNSSGGSNIFLYDRLLETTRLVTHRFDAPQSATNASSVGVPAISADGRFVAYTSNANLLVPGPETAGAEVYLYDRSSGANTLVAQGAQPSGLRMSADGRFVVFYDHAPSIVPGQIDPAGKDDVFLFDRTTGKTVLVSHAAGSPLTAANDGSGAPEISADGSVVAYVSWATDLVAGQSDTRQSYDLFLYDRAQARTVLLSHSAGSPTSAANGSSGSARLSANGRWVVFGSAATDLVSGITDANQSYDAFLYDRLSGATTLLSHASGTPNVTAITGAGAPFLSADGQRIVFSSTSTDLAPLPSGVAPWARLYLLDRSAGTTLPLAQTDRAVPPYPHFQYPIDLSPQLAADGHAIAFGSGDAQLEAGDFNGTWDVYLYDSSPGPFVPCTLLDTRRAGDGPALRSNVRRAFAAAGVCGVPATARSLQIEVTALQGSGKGNLQLYPGNVTRPAAGTLRFAKGASRTQSFTLAPATNGAGTLAILPFVAGNGTVQVVVKVTGFTP